MRQNEINLFTKFYRVTKFIKLAKLHPSVLYQRHIAIVTNIQKEKRL
jgi:hypothetical protein